MAMLKQLNPKRTTWANQTNQDSRTTLMSI
jgi:hypothetical protein